jgi:hypothetical protein
VLTEGRLQTLLANPDGRYPHRRIDLSYPPGERLQAAIERVCDEAVAAVRDGGAVLLVLSDRAIAPDRCRFTPCWRPAPCITGWCVTAALRRQSDYRNRHRPRSAPHWGVDRLRRYFGASLAGL